MIKKLTSPFREFGPIGGLLYALDRVLSRLTRHAGAQCFDLMVQPVSDRPLVPERLARAYTTREINPGDPEIERMPVQPGIPEFRFSQDAVCLGLFRDDECLGYMWYCHRSYQEDVARLTYILTPADQAVFDFDFFLYPEHRMGFGFVVLWDAANRRLTDRGIRYSFSRLSRFNLQSKRSHDHFGWKRVGGIAIIRAWFLEVGFASVFPFLHISVRESGRTKLKLRPDVLGPRSGNESASNSSIAQAREGAVQ